MSKTSPELAKKIVDLLLNDPGVADSWSIQRVSPEDSRPLEEQTCVGCHEHFMPKAVGRQFCSRDCYNDYLERKRQAKGKTKTSPNANGPLDSLDQVVASPEKLPIIAVPVRAWLQSMRFNKRYTIDLT